jgi:hypothetical protein
MYTAILRAGFDMFHIKGVTKKAVSFEAISKYMSEK